MIDKKTQGKRNRAAGARFEKRVYEDLKSNGWFVSKFQSNVDLEKQEFISAKASTQFRRGTSGFPDFICWKRVYNHFTGNYYWILMGVESKVNGYLDRKEKEKCKFLLGKRIFGKISIAKKTKVKGKIVVEYKKFEVVE